ncbi:MAG: hypothetical protein NC095_01235 [Muribaculum sp.]|nr:hypothetical protein [Muribaculum sp.]
MKKIIMILMALCLMAPVANAQLDKKAQKKVEKMAKTRAKELQKEGFTIMGSMPLQDALVKHFSSTETGFDEQIGTGRAKSKNNGRQMCMSNCLNEYSAKVSSQIKGRSVTDSYGNQVDTENDPEFDRFYAAYERLTQNEIKGELQESFTVQKSLPDGSYEFRMFMLIDKDKAREKRQKALRDAALESKLAQAYADQLSKYIEKD